MDSLTAENVQALILLAFVHINDGNLSKAWPMVGTLTRAVVHLGLHMEPDQEQEGESFVGPLRFLPPARVWTELEERRRVFWNVFLLDRFCSIVTGSNMSLSSEDVQVRLPSDGLYWVKEEPVTTPFLNIWDISVTKIGKSVSFLPRHFSTLADKAKYDAARTGSSERVTPVPLAPEPQKVDASTIGSFAYCVEATEGLNRVVKFFLQRPVNRQVRQEFSSWLVRFKELDLQLIHWKMFLPRRWKDSNISKEPAFIHFDPNLTLAHITHNTSMILLHQSIAYPHASILDKLKLASNASVETCQLASSETANIAQKYLQYTPFVGLVAPQFVFCAFISARAMLVHAHFHNTEPPDAYGNLLSCLQQMSDRWISMNPTLKLRSDAKDFAKGLLLQLQRLQESIASPNFFLSALEYITEVNYALGIQAPVPTPENSQWLEERRAQQRHSIIPVSTRQSHYISSNGLRRGSDRQNDLATTLHTPSSEASLAGQAQSDFLLRARPPGGQAYFLPTSQTNDVLSSNYETSPMEDNIDEFAQLSANFLLDPQYCDMDRIISFQDTFIH